MEEKTCFIIGAGEVYAAKIARGENDLVIAADGGYQRLKKLGVKPDLLMGDFDSLKTEPDDVETLRFGPEKDDTDMMLAIKYAYAHGYRDFRLYGGVGGRLSHTLANVQALTYLAKRGARALLYGDETVVTAIENGAVRFGAEDSGIVSVFAHGGEARGVFIEGMKYPLNDAVLSCDFPLGVSNELLHMPARVKVKEGTLVIVWEKTL